MPKFRQGRHLKNWKNPRPVAEAGKLRIIGGRFRGRQIDYSGDPITRPMKDNVREALFNLVGGWIKNRVAIDLFAGSGAVGIEALSRGAKKLFLIERHFPTIRIIRENVQSLEPDLPVDISASDTFFWIREFLKTPEKMPSDPWIVFCCPPYALFKSKQNELLESIEALINAAPKKSIFVVESDDSFDVKKLPFADQWHVRQYTPARIAVYRAGVKGFELDDDQAENESE